MDLNDVVPDSPASPPVNQTTSAPQTNTEPPAGFGIIRRSPTWGDVYLAMFWAALGVLIASIIVLGGGCYHIGISNERLKLQNAGFSFITETTNGREANFVECPCGKKILIKGD